MSGKQRGNGKMIQLADRLFGNKKRSMGIALGIAAVSYVLAWIFGDGILRCGAALAAPLMGLLSFCGMFFVMGIQLINPFCTPGLMDFGELFFGFSFGGFGLIRFVTTGFWKLLGETAAETVIMVFMIAGIWCALCVIHNMRK